MMSALQFRSVLGRLEAAGGPRPAWCSRACRGIASSEVSSVTISHPAGSWPRGWSGTHGPKPDATGLTVHI